jgi:serine/threonine-protein kinase
VTDVLSRLKAALADRYRFERPLGSGGAATVYLAQDLKHSRQVAIKVLRPELAAAVGPERFLKEIEIVGRLQHPHILTLIDSGEADGLLYYVMPYVEGESLRQRLTRERHLPVDESNRLAREVADALAYAHGEGVIHRDIKPENIMLSGGHAVVTDFGIARAMSEAGGERLTQTGFAAGTPAYMSPEQASAEDDVDARADVYALGCVLYEMLAGEPPFGGGSNQAIFTKHMLDPVPSVRRLRPTVPQQLDSAVSRALAKVPTDRHATARSFGAVLERAGQEPSAAQRTLQILATRRNAVLAAVLVVVLVAVAAVFFRARMASGPALSPNRVAVMPFSVRGSNELAYLGGGMVELLSLALDGAGEIQTVDPHALLSSIPADEGGTLGPEDAANAARRFGAGRYVLGSVVQAGGRLEVTASVYEVGGGAPLVASAEADGEQAILDVTDELAREIVANLSAGTELRLSRLAATTTQSFTALKAYLDGERAYHTLDFPEAIDAFQRAIAEDSSFALAYYRLSQAAVWAATDIRLGQWAAERAMELRDRLSERERRLLEAFRALEQNDGREAERIYRSIIATYPDELQAWYWLGETLFHFNFRWGRRITESRFAFERAAFLSPRQIEPLVHFAQVTAIEGDRPTADSLIGALLALEPVQFAALPMRALRAILADDSLALQAVKEDLRFADDVTRFQTVWTPAVGVVDLDGVEELNQFLADDPTSSETEASSRTVLAHVALARGHRIAARDQLAQVRSLDYPTGLTTHALLETLPFGTDQVTLIRVLRAELDSWNAEVPARESSYFILPSPGEYPASRAYLLGLLSARLGFDRLALGYARGLEQVAATEVGSLHGDLALGVRAEVARLAGNTLEALGYLERTQGHVSSFQAYASPFAGQARERFLRAELLRAMGRDVEAINWYESIGDGAAYDFAYLGPAQLGLGQVHEARGDTAAAVHHYRRFLELWSESDEEFRPMVDTARARLGQLADSVQ